jgi:hypothetical protein
MTVTISGSLFKTVVSSALMRQLAARTSALIRADLQKKGSGTAGANGVQWAPISEAAKATRAARDKRYGAILRQRKNLTIRERELMSDIRGRGILPRGSENEQKRRDIIGHEICETVEYKAIHAERADMRASRQALIDELGNNPIGHSSGALIRSFREGEPGNVFEIKADSFTVGSSVSYAEAFDANRELIPSQFPSVWMRELEGLLVEGLIA